MKVLIVAGGTAGHTIPALVVAEELRLIDKNIKILFVTSRKEQDLSLITKDKFEAKKIFAGKFRRYFSLLNLSDIFLTFVGFLQSFFIVISFKPDVIFSKGSYISVPVVLAGKLLGKKIILHESDFILGLANKKSLAFADKLAVSYPEDFYPDIKTEKIIFTGNPVRNLKISEKSIKEKVIMIIGGSQGAQKINEIVFDLLDEFLDHVKIIHITGELGFNDAKDRKKALSSEKSSNYLLFSNVFENDKFGDLLSEADIVVSRAGAGAVAEMSVMGKPTIFVPLAGHQEENARLLEKNRAAIVVKNEDLSPEILKYELLNILRNESLALRLSDNISTFSNPKAGNIIAQEIIKLAEKNK